MWGRKRSAAKSAFEHAPQGTSLSVFARSFAGHGDGARGKDFVYTSSPLASVLTTTFSTDRLHSVGRDC